MSEPEVVYHYTSTDTLLKIVEGEPPAIWATNLRYLNDVSESKHCIDCLKSRVSTFLAENSIECADELTSAMDILYDDRYGIDPPYVASFSAVKDSLPQWRSYCPNGNGVSIGFRISALKQSVLTFTPPSDFPAIKSRFEKIHYLHPDDVAVQDEIFRTCIAAGMEYEEEQNSLPPEERSSFSWESMLHYEISSRSSLYKHPAFQAEEEYRLIAPPLVFSGASIRCRCSRTTVIPFVSLLLPPVEKSDRYVDSFISEIIVGPTPNAELTENALRMFFQSKGWNVSISSSPIPYRDL
jgi:hypothetical protein